MRGGAGCREDAGCACARGAGGRGVRLRMRGGAVSEGRERRGRCGPGFGRRRPLGWCWHGTARSPPPFPSPRLKGLLKRVGSISASRGTACGLQRAASLLSALGAGYRRRLRGLVASCEAADPS